MVKASSGSGGKACLTSFLTRDLNLLRIMAMLGRMCSLCWAKVATGAHVMGCPVVSSKRTRSSSHVMPKPLGVVVPLLSRRKV